MKYLFFENDANYSKYQFPYQVYAKLEGGDNYADVSNKGFIPTRVAKDTFVLGRSTRVNLSSFELSSENRRVMKKFPEFTMLPIENNGFKYDYTIGKLAKTFYAKFGDVKVSPQRIKWAITSGAFTHILKFENNGEFRGYCIANIRDGIMSYVFPFYDLDVSEPGTGMAMMLNAINWAKSENLMHVYLGSCYSESALYKTQFKGFEWFDGVNWDPNIKALKALVREGSNEVNILEKLNEA